LSVSNAGKLLKLTVLVCVLILLAACGRSSGSSGGSSSDLVKVKIQLCWVPQAEFAGFYVAKAKGYYGGSSAANGSRATRRLRSSSSAGA